ncbi:sigma-70 RNA polymerase sigma factor region 4 domain-containing protein [Paenibacillus hexagrammi]|uniref:Sigma-70 family RNA polymerase sigma factor n=1 Tax=Paenibacillus hexagrammi TaxID=2908839 RepID=A0ABY3SRV5_9BACL|nr:hypothetical protein [Paenibacillus sp. YPD9-1]UJF36602.1 hypothetical protein L0M14_30400 [Paenibacillus sp. YPD9-1]
MALVIDSIEAIVVKAQNDLSAGSDFGLRELFEKTRDKQRKQIESLSRRYHYIERDLIESVYVECVWLVVEKFNSQITDFFGYLYSMVRNRVVDIARKEVPHMQNDTSFDRLMDIYQSDDEQFLRKEDHLPSAEATYFNDNELVEQFKNHLNSLDNLGDREKAILLSRVEHGTSLNEAIDICELGHIYKNKQALWRASVKKLNGGFATI